MKEHPKIKILILLCRLH